MPARLPFPAYLGTDPYLFVSYAHADSAVVYPEMEWLHGLGHRIWFDEGIEIGSEWTNAIAQAIDNCAQFLVFMSPNAAKSVHVKEEIYHAFKRKKTILCVYLQPTTLPSGLDMRLGPIQAIHKYELPVETYRAKLSRALVRHSQSVPGKERQVPAPPKPAEMTAAFQEIPASTFVNTPRPTQKAGDTITGPHGIELVWCPPWTFLMGSPMEEEKRSKNEVPHKVTLTPGFWIGKFPVTQEQWEAAMGDSPSHFKGAQNPVECVNWDAVQSFLQKVGGGFRLPTEAEWECACRAGSAETYCFGGDEAKLGDYAWYDKNSGNTTHPVGLKWPNAWGLHDMHGNVQEWCQDWYGRYSKGTGTDPTGPSSGEVRVRRGGGFDYGAAACRSAYRGWASPGLREGHPGFRVVADSIPIRGGK